MAKKRSNNEGSIYKRGDKYRAQVTLADGRRTSRSFNSEDEALAWKTQQINDMNQSSFIAPNNITLGDWTLQHLEVYVKPRTVIRTYERYISLLPHITPIADLPLQDVRPIHIQQLLNNASVKRARYENKEKIITFVPASSSTKKKIYNLLMMTYKQALLEGLAKINPVFAVTAPRQTETEPKFFSKSEIELMRNYEDKNNRHHLATLIALGTGMRASEILGLRWVDFNPKRLTLSVNQTVQYDAASQLVVGPTKTKNSKRTISISKDLAKLIEAQSENSSEYILATAKGLPLRQQTLFSWFKKFLEEKNIPYQSFHTLRHTHATMLLNAGIPITDVSARLGHSKVSTTLDIYTHAAESDKKLVTISSNIIGI